MGQVRARWSGRRTGLAERLRAEEEHEARYRQAAQAAGEDALLGTLFRELAEETAAHGARMRRLMEGGGIDRGRKNGI